MAHSKSAKKRIKTSERNRIRNKVQKSKLKTFLKNFAVILTEGNIDAIKESLKITCKELDKAASKGIIHKNAAGRTKSRLTAKVNKL